MSRSSVTNSSPILLDPAVDTHYNRLRLCLALVILRNKPSQFTIKGLGFLPDCFFTIAQNESLSRFSVEYIDFVKCSINCSTTTTTGVAKCKRDIVEAVKQQLKRKCTFEEDKLITNNNLPNDDVFSVKDSREVEEPKRVSNPDILHNPWKKRAFELEHEVERLKQRLCVFEIELENAKQTPQVAATTTARRKKTKPQQDHNRASSTVLATTTTTTNKKQSKKTAIDNHKITSFFEYIDPDAQIINQINAGDEGPWELFDIMQAMSFIQQMKNLRQATVMSAQDSVIPQTIIKIINYINFKLTALFSIIKTSNKTCNNLWQTYSSCVQSFGNISKKLLEFLRLPTLPASQYDDILSTLANALATLIRAIYPLTKIVFNEALQEHNPETYAGNNKLLPNKDQDPRELIAQILVNLCTNVEPRLKEPVAFVAAKECSRLIKKDIVHESASEHTFHHDSTFSKEKHKQQFDDDHISICEEMILKDTGYYLLWMLDKIITCSADSEGKLSTALTAETIKNIASLLESNIFKDSNQITSLHGDSLSVYISNIFEKLWTHKNTNNNNDSDFSLIERMLID
ncbi:10814_t:CDS:2 [Ambispora gerdemannii]|uniref:10814_t:CDS:1 n=1 Tax=Ambispora gerdemannii TaxID=144530 RepID=A0A9N9CAJ5_9GLOM|nr:10814_t:CDS:2 [Ambispora gerdemannii]